MPSSVPMTSLLLVLSLSLFQISVSFFLPAPVKYGVKSTSGLLSTSSNDVATAEQQYKVLTEQIRTSMIGSGDLPPALSDMMSTFLDDYSR